MFRFKLILLESVVWNGSRLWFLIFFQENHFPKHDRIITHDNFAGIAFLNESRTFPQIFVFCACSWYFAVIATDFITSGILIAPVLTSLFSCTSGVLVQILAVCKVYTKGHFPLTHAYFLLILWTTWAGAFYRRDVIMYFLTNMEL